MNLLESKTNDNNLTNNQVFPLVYKRSSILFVIIACILIFWTIESLLDAWFVHNNSTFLEQLLVPSKQELLVLLLVILLFICIGIYFRWTMTHMLKANHLLKQEVNERQNAEQAYKDLSIKIELILNSAGEGIYGLDAEGNVTFVNPAATAITRYASEDLIGRNIHSLLHHTTARGVPHSVEDCPIYGSLKNGQVRQVAQDLFWTKEGKSFPVAYVSAPMYKDGQVTGVVVIFRDITDRVQVEEQLKKERDFIAALLDTVGALVVVLDLQGHIVSFNRACEQVSGYSGAEVEGKAIWGLLIPPEEREEAKRIFQTLLPGDVPGVNENHWVTRGGARRLIAWSNTTLKDAAGQVTHVIGTGIDVTERRQAENELKQANDYLENILDNSADAIGIVDTHGKIIKWNKASNEVFGYASEDIQGKSSFELYADKNELDQMLTQLRRAGSVRRYEIRMKKKDGSVATFALSINFLYDPRHRVIGSVCVARDRSEFKKTLDDLATLNDQLFHEVTERKQVEAALQDANRSLKEVVGEFEQRNRDITLLNQMGDLLQACLTCQEAYSGIAHFASLLFPDDAGALFILQDPKKLVEAVATWGELASDEPVFSPEACWALRRGEIHTAHVNQPGVICPHLADAPPADHMCIPLIAQGEITGLILLQSRVCRMDSPEPLRNQLTENKQRLALTLAKQISLALANLKLRDSLRARAVRDPLTGLFNRRYMEETLEREIQRVKRRNQPLGVIMVDVDSLKTINDSLGHEAGDKVIIALGHLLQTHIRQEDIVCRYGGDEFTLIMPEASLEIVCQRAEELRSGLNGLQVEFTGQPLGPLSASFGVATFPDHGFTGEELVRAADGALYHAKQRGRNQVDIAGASEKAAADD